MKLELLAAVVDLVLNLLGFCFGRSPGKKPPGVATSKPGLFRTVVYKSLRMLLMNS